MSKKIKNIKQKEKISNNDLALIKQAKKNMHDTGVLMKGIDKVGGLVEIGMRRIPLKTQLWLQKHVNKILMATLKANLLTLQKGKEFKKPSKKTYKTLVTSTGIASGVFGSTTGIGTVIFTSEMAISTKFIMRSIMDIARSHGEDLHDINTQLACLQVFAFGNSSKNKDGLETSYYSTRVAMNSAIKEATKFVAQNGLKDLSKLLISSTNPLLKFLGTIAGRFTIQVSEKFIAQAIPIIGAVGGGSLNFAFINHFQKIAVSHFTIRALERKYGSELIMETYEQIEINKKP